MELFHDNADEMRRVLELPQKDLLEYLYTPPELQPRLPNFSLLRNYVRQGNAFLGYVREIFPEHSLLSLAIQRIHDHQPQWSEPLYEKISENL